MNNCFVKKLNATINDSEKKMEYFGGVIITLLGQTAGAITSVQVGRDVKAKFIDGDAHFVAGASDPTVIEDAEGWITTTNFCYYKPSVETPVRVLIKPGSTVAQSSFSNFLDMDLNKLDLYTPNIIALTNPTDPDMTLHFKSTPGCLTYMKSFNVSGHLDGEINLDHLSNATNMFLFSVYTSEKWNITGHLSSLGTMTVYNGKATIRLPKNNLVSKDIEGLAAAFIVGKENGNKCVINAANTAGLTYGGQPIINVVVTITVDSTAASGYTVTMV